MRIYLRIVNPIIALVIFLLCIWAGFHDIDGDLKPDKVLLGCFNIYFLAKGLFCSSSLFILGIVANHLLGYDSD